MQLHGQVASILKCKQTITIVMRKNISRNTVQFLYKIDHNPESQLRKLLKIFNRALYCRVFGILLIVLKKIL